MRITRLWALRMQPFFQGTAPEAGRGTGTTGVRVQCQETEGYPGTSAASRAWNSSPGQEGKREGE